MEPRPPTSRGEELLGHGRFLRSLARALTADPAHAEDLVQDTWVAALQNPPATPPANEPPGAARIGARQESAVPPRAWLARVLRRLAIKKGLREAERGARELASVRERVHETQEPQAIALEIELSRQVLESLEGLREPYRSTLYLRYYRGLAPLAIAAEGGVPVKTVKTRLARGLELMREEMDRRHDGRRAAWVALLLPLARAPIDGVPAPSGVAAAHAGSALPAAGGVPAWLLAAGLVLASAAAWRLLPSGAGELRLEPQPSPSAPTSASAQELSPQAAPVRRDVRAPSAPQPAATPDLVRLRGRVLDEQGEPLSGAEVSASTLGSVFPERVFPERAFAGPERRPGFKGLASSGEADPLWEAHTLTDGEGTFALELSGSGLALLVIGLDGFAPAGRRLPVFPGQDLDLGVLALAHGVFLSGRVLDELGRPVENALLHARRSDEGLTLDPESGRSELVARSDGQGRFRVARQAVGDWQLEIRSPDHAPGRARGSTTVPGQLVEGLEVVLAPGARITGRVHGLTSEELERVLVVARLGGLESDPSRFEPVRALPDADGAFELRSLPEGEELGLAVVLADGRDSRMLGEPQLVLAGERNVALFPDRPQVGREAEPELKGPALGAPPAAGSVRIRVAAPDGTPAAGALVLRRGDTRRPFWPEETDVRVADEHGEVVWAGLADGAHEFRAVHGAFGLSAAFRERDWRLVSLPDAAGDALALEVPPQGKLVGRASTGGVPLPGARILLWPAGGQAARRGSTPALVRHTDGDGRFDYGALPCGDYRLELSHPSRARVETDMLGLTSAGESLVLEFPDARLSGLVRGADGTALAGASVRVLGDEQEEVPLRWERGALERGVASDAAGRFELLGLDPSLPLRLEVSAPGHATLRTSDFLPGSHQELSLAVEALLELELTSSTESVLRVFARGPAGVERALTMPTGSTRVLRGLGQGTWTLEVSSRSWREGRKSPRGQSFERPSVQREVVLEAGRSTHLRWDLP